MRRQQYADPIYNAPFSMSENEMMYLQAGTHDHAGEMYLQEDPSMYLQEAAMNPSSYAVGYYADGTGFGGVR
jgi:hypothetical protein